MREIVEWVIAVAIMAAVVFSVIYSFGKAVEWMSGPSDAALPPNVMNEAPLPPVTVSCAFKMVAFYVAVDFETLEPLSLINPDAIDIAVLPAPCPKE